MTRTIHNIPVRNTRDLFIDLLTLGQTDPLLDLPVRDFWQRRRSADN
uniref:Uncharacterized protein n=1 Tax=Candidatus Kentrum sp. MB TaxID=2138164 RepID=A0A450XVS5_9GAMM|nr:MAG: hypothetical protein BECKMB1821G_GA0114241_10434 [Candidatus Kentron sp. MB]VFK33401.1 MAG: hypothetical protein BECKMB1821I_GA0114274_10454 [Candidatus Kentron sp. MB]VFK76147.1 MAG: hypothetical protein BECKMB1821H_GA0114242_10444 [Candidatus Kentron sp. MB]